MARLYADSPRLYVNSDPYSSKQNFVAVSDTPKEISELLTGLHAPPKQASTIKLSGPFAKAAEGGKKKKKEKKKKGKALLLENEEKLHAYIRDFVLPSLDASEIKESPYYERKNRFENRRTNMIKKVQREARMETLAAARTVDPGYGSLRSSTRLRRGAGAPVNGYDEHARDQEIEEAIRESERAAKRRRKAAGSDVDSDEDEEYDDKMELDANGNEHSDDEDNFLDDEDEEGASSSRRASRRKNRRSGASNSNTRVSIPGERRSSRQTAPASYTYRVPSPEIVSTTKSQKASIVRSHSPDFDLSNDFEDLKEEEPFGGLEEVWTMGRYRGYYRPDGTFIKAQKGDIPLYKLAKMGLPLPPLTGPIPGSSASNDDATTSSTKSKASSTAQSIAERIARINGEVPSSSSSKPQSSSNGKQAANQSMDLDGDESLPASAVPTLLADDRETDDSHVLPDDSTMEADDDDDDDDESDIVVVSSSSSKKPTSNGKTMNTAKESTQDEKVTKDTGGARDTSHISVVV